MKKQLPIEAKEAEIISAVQENQVIVIVGETGSGKTTQVPVMLYKAGFARKGRIGITQPRRLATTTVAEYVAELTESKLGSIVGYKIRFEDTTTEGTAIKFVTNGVLLREVESDSLLSKYSIIIVDEAHERSLEIDLLLGLLKNILKARKDFKVVIMSATIDAQRFSDYFSDGSTVPIVSVEGRMYPVDVQHVDWDPRPQEVISTVVEMITSIHNSQADGDVLVFMSGKDDIIATCDELEKNHLSNVIILPLYGEMGSFDRNALFRHYPGKRKIVIATNIAETSITMDGIVFVVDSGLIKQRSFHPETGIESLDVVLHSQAGCEQRKGRAGRTRPGICYRLYSKRNYHQEREAITSPEILRANLARVVLIMEKMGIRHVERFDFIDPPSRPAIKEAYQSLIILGAIDFRTKKLTELGRKMANLPLEPRMAKMLIEAAKYRCVKSVAVFAAFQSVSHVFVRPPGKEEEADRAHARFIHPKSDALTMINLWNRFVATGRSSQWCYHNFVSYQALEETGLVYEQLLSVLENNGVAVVSSMNEEMIMKSIVSGLVYNLIEHQSRFRYQGIFHETDEIYLHPSSSLYKSMPRFIVAMHLVQTTRLFARGCTAAPLEWLMEFLPQLFKHGTPVLKSYVNGDSHVLGEQPILFRGKMISQRNVKIPLEIALKLNEERDKAMEQKHLFRLTFEEKNGNYVTNHGGAAIELNRRSTVIPVKPGVPYYCDIAYFGSIPFATACEEAFDLGVIPSSSNLTRVTENRDVQSLAKGLADGWQLALKK